MTNIEPMAADRGDIVAKPSRQRSRVANGTKLLPMTDGRSATARRFKDLTEDISQDMGVERLSELERQLIRRASMLCAECERMEAQAARGEGFDANMYGAMCDRIGRIAQRLGISRLARDLNPADRALSELFSGIDRRLNKEIEGEVAER